MKRNKFLIAIFFAAVCSQAQLSFNNVDSLFAYAERNSSTSKTNAEQKLLAKWMKVAAIGNTFNLRNPVSFSVTDNLMLPVSFIPADAFGGPRGTFKQITLGQQYVSNFNFNPQIDIINPANWARVKSASVNEELTETSTLLARKNLFESISAAYYNIITAQEQILSMEKNLAATDTLVNIAGNKFKEGLIREQDVNNVTATRLAVQDRLFQLKAGLEQQVNSLKILCDIPVNNSLTIEKPAAYTNGNYPSELKATSLLFFKNSLLQEAYMRSELRANRWTTLPVLSAVYYQGWQQNSNASFFDSKAPWIQSQYIGLRLTMPIPSDVNRLSMNYTSKINYRIAKIGAEHAQLQNDLNNQNLELEYERALSSFTSSKEIYQLKTSNYEKSLNQYKEGIISTDILLNAYTDLLNAQVNLSSAHASLEHAKTKISINNTLK